jgi:methionine synthase II (cobalamin-independent)
MTEFQFLTTHVGSLPYLKTDELTEKLSDLLDVPAWPQLTRRCFRENMYVQYSPKLPAIREDAQQEKVYFQTRADITEALEAFYTPIIADDVEAFALQPEYASGFFAMLETLQKTKGEWAKGQVTGPISFGLTVTDQDLRASLYNDLLADAIVKNSAMNARWQIRQLKSVRPNVILFLDEPYMAAFGSAFISLSREQAIGYLDEVFDAIHLEGGLGGIHCCANTDWSVLLATKVDILNLDAYGFIENLALYPVELREYLDRGGSVCWGIVPNNEQIFNETPQRLAERLRNGINLIVEKAALRGATMKAEEFASRSLIAPACGLGSTSVEVADRVLEVLVEAGDILKRG